MTLAVAAVLVTVAIPSFQTTIQNNRLIAQNNDFLTALMLARSEAVKRGVSTTVCKSTDLTACTAANNWEQGWIVFVDTDSDGVKDAGEDILRTHAALGITGTTLKGTAGDYDEYISYRGDGVSSEAGTFVLCDDRGFADGKAITVSATGRARTTSAPDSSETTCTP